jgi:hypothetical protein
METTMNLAQIKDNIAMDAHGMTKDAAIYCGICIACHKKARWYSEAGRKEYLISGTCEPCFDSLFEIHEQDKTMDGSEFIAPNSERAFHEAKLLGLEVVLPKANELQIDIDSTDDYALFDMHFGILLQYEAAHISRDEPSKSGGEKRHITIGLHRDVTNMERMLLQATLGSDRKREILSWVQERNGDPNPTLFLEKTLLLTEGTQQ